MALSKAGRHSAVSARALARSLATPNDRFLPRLPSRCHWVCSKILRTIFRPLFGHMKVNTDQRLRQAPPAAVIRLHDCSSLIHLRPDVSDFAFSACARNAVAFSSDCCIANRIAFRNRHSFFLAATAYRRTFQESKGALDRPGGDGWSRVGHRYRSAQSICVLRRPRPRRRFQNERQRRHFPADLRQATDALHRCGLGCAV